MDVKNILKMGRSIKSFILGALIVLLVGVCKSSSEGAVSVPPDKAVIFFRLSCIPGELSWRSKTTMDIPYYVCKKSPGLISIQVTPSLYSWIAFEDYQERIEWNRWTFHAPEAGKFYYWGDIQIKSAFAQVEYNEDTITEFVKKFNPPGGKGAILKGLKSFK